MPPLRVTIRPVSGHCNLRCDYCFYQEGRMFWRSTCAGRMSDGTAEQVIRGLLESARGSCTIVFEGGEPTLAGIGFYRRWLALEQKYNRNRAVIHHILYTNGFTLDEAWCAFLKQSRFQVLLSVDGIRSTHDQFRRDRNGQGTYFRVLDAIGRLQAYGVDFQSVTVVNRKTAAVIWKIYVKYKKMGIQPQNYLPCIDEASGRTGQERYALTPEMYGRFLIQLFELWVIDLRKGCEPSIPQFEEYVLLLLERETGHCREKESCEGEQVIVESDGSVYPDSLPGRGGSCLGNLRVDSLETILERDRILRREEISLWGRRACEDCPYADLCAGGLRRHPDLSRAAWGAEYFCEGYRMFFDGCLEELRRVASDYGESLQRRR